MTVVEHGEAERLRMRHSIRLTANRQGVRKAVAKSWNQVTNAVRISFLPYVPIDSPHHPALIGRIVNRRLQPR
jgi:hypothetical protein